MADRSALFVATNTANTQLAVPSAGIPAGSAGTYTLHLVNDTDVPVVVTNVWLSDGTTPTDANKIAPQFTIEPRGYWMKQPITLGEGWKVFVTASAALSVQLIGQKGN